MAPKSGICFIFSFSSGSTLDVPKAQPKGRTGYTSSSAGYACRPPGNREESVEIDFFPKNGKTLAMMVCDEAKLHLLTTRQEGEVENGGQHGRGLVGADGVPLSEGRFAT